MPTIECRQETRELITEAATAFRQMCESDVLNRIERVMKEHHSQLATAGVTVDAVFAINVDGDAVMLHGYPCAATVKKISYKQRVMGRADAELTIDQENWNDLTERQQDALIDHELTHVELVRNLKTNVVKRDRADRPKLAMRLHDWQLGGFADTAKRYGKDAPEVILARGFNHEFGQLCFEFARAKKGDGE